MAVPNIILLKGISKSYSKKKVLQNVELDIQKGEIFGIIGMSGSGKTTLLEILIGFQRPDTGDVLFLDNGDYKSVFKGQSRVKQLFGFAAQAPSFYEKLTVEENLRYFGTMYGLSEKRIRENINKLLPLVGLTDERDSIADELSGGMQKRLDIACAMIHGPDVLILDEPTADLDIVLRKQIWDLVKRINSVGTTVIISSHFLQELESICYRIAIINKRTTTMVGKVSELREKYTRLSEIIVHTRPGKYAAVIKSLLDKNVAISRHALHGTDLILSVEDPEPVLHQLIHVLEAHKEFLVNIEVKKPSLDEIFESIAEKTAKELNIK